MLRPQCPHFCVIFESADTEVVFFPRDFEATAWIMSSEGRHYRKFFQEIWGSLFIDFSYLLTNFLRFLKLFCVFWIICTLFLGKFAKKNA